MAKIDVEISATTTRFRAGINKALDSLKKMKSRALKGMANFGKNMAKRMYRGMKIGIVAGAGAVVGLIYKSLQTRGQFQTLDIQLKYAFGGAEEGLRAMQDVIDVKKITPFDITDIAEAARMMAVFSEGARGFKDDLVMLGDAAAATPASIQELAFWFGRAASMARTGMPMGDAVRRLSQLGILTDDTRQKLDRLQRRNRRGRRSEEIIGLLEQDMKRYSGTAAELAKTVTGSFTMLSAAFKLFKNELAKGFDNTAVRDILRIRDAFLRLADTGRAETFGRALEVLYGRFKAFGNNVIRRIFPDIGKSFEKIVKQMNEGDFEGAFDTLKDLFADSFGKAVNLGIQAVDRYLVPALKQAADIFGKALIAAIRESIPTLGEIWDRAMYRRGLRPIKIPDGAIEITEDSLRNVKKIPKTPSSISVNELINRIKDEPFGGDRVLRVYVENLSEIENQATGDIF